MEAMLNILSLIYTDDVTGLGNSRYLSKVLGDLESTKETFSILFIDIDHFKKINDENGHLKGTEMLKELAGIIKSNIRKGDLIRYGGDEFIIILKTSQEIACIIAERLRKIVEGHVFSTGLKITLSIGIASTQTIKANKVLELADKAMYEVKKKSRNSVFVW